jgi:hypothetical protein
VGETQDGHLSTDAHQMIQNRSQPERLVVRVRDDRERTPHLCQQRHPTPPVMVD